MTAVKFGIKITNILDKAWAEDGNFKRNIWRAIDGETKVRMHYPRIDTSTENRREMGSGQDLLSGYWVGETRPTDHTRSMAKCKEYLIDSFKVPMHYHLSPLPWLDHYLEGDDMTSTNLRKGQNWKNISWSITFKRKMLFNCIDLNGLVYTFHAYSTSSVIFNFEIITQY